MPLQNHLQLPESENSKERNTTERMLEGIVHSLRGKFQEFSKARYDKESEWESAIKQYEGEWDPADLSKIEDALSMQKTATQPVSVNITRSKTNIAIARMKDIQFPTGGDFNFFLKPAPLTPVQKAMKNQQKPDPQMELAAVERGVDPATLPAPSDLVEEQVQNNVDRAPAMERLLRNRMINAEYGRKARLAIEDLCIKGTAVVKGPTIQDKKYRRYEAQQTTEGREVQVLREEFLAEPSVERVDPLYFFPDPSARLPEEVEDCFELHPMSASELIELLKNPAFIPDNIRKVLEEDPDAAHVPDIVARTSQEKSNANVRKRYWVREYHGPLDKKVLREAEMIDEKMADDPASRFTGEVWYCNKTVIRMSLSHIEGEDQLPYGISTWEKDPNSVFGHGCPFLLKNAQRVANQAYLMLLDNASLTAGPQIVLNREMIEPANKGDYGIEPMKVWFMTEYGANVQEAMQFIDIPAQMQGISQIMDTSMQFADMESSTPLMQQGEMPSGNNTTTGMAMIMSATNIVQKAASMNWDDYITKPLVQRFYHYEMQYGDDPEVKGDFEVEVGGATERIEAQIRAQEIERMLGLAGSNEEFMMHLDANKAFRALADNTRTGDILRSQAEVDAMVAEQEAAAQNQPPDPEGIKAEAAMITAQARQQEAQARAQLDQAKQQLATMEVQTRYQSQVAEAQSRQNQATLEYQAKLAQIAADQQKTVAELQKDLQIKDMEHAMNLELAEIDFAKMEREIEVKSEFGTGI